MIANASLIEIPDLGHAPQLQFRFEHGVASGQLDAGGAGVQDGDARHVRHHTGVTAARARRAAATSAATAQEA